MDTNFQPYRSTGSCLKNEVVKSRIFLNVKLVQIMDVSVKIENAHTESSGLCLHNLERLDIYVVARLSPIFSLIGQQEVALKNEVVAKTGANIFF